MANRTIGILGGMGPEATLALFERIIRATPAVRDQEHHHVIIDNNPQIPDRTAAIKGQGEDCLPALVKSARTLERAGADFIIIPCNTAHFWFEGIQAAVSIPVLNMITETAALVSLHAPKLHKLGLMATDGTLATGLYQKALTRDGTRILIPEADEQAAVMETIYHVKAGDYSFRSKILDVARGLIARGAEGIALGCTEIPLVVHREDLPCPIFDPLSAIAMKAVELASREA